MNLDFLMVILIGSCLAGFGFTSVFSRLDAWSLVGLFISAEAFLLVPAGDFFSDFKDWKLRGYKSMKKCFFIVLSHECCWHEQVTDFWRYIGQLISFIFGSYCRHMHTPILSNLNCLCMWVLLNALPNLIVYTGLPEPGRLYTIGT